MNFSIFKKIVIFFFSIFQNIFIFFLYFLSGLKSKKKNLWCFGSLGGKEFRGNTKYLFNHLKKNHPEIEIYWISKSRNISSQLKKEGVNSIYAYDLEGMKKISSASLFFCTHGFADVVLALTRRAKIIHLGHMTCSIKENSLKKRLIQKKSFLLGFYELVKLGYFYIRKINYGIYSSNFTKENLTIEDKWYAQKKLILGLPKTDYLLSVKNNKKCDQILKKNTYKEKIILFLPTRRNDKSFHIFNYGFSEKKIEEFAKFNNCKFFISHHPTNANKIIPDYKSDKIQTLKLNGNSIDDALSSADLLVTDYGSVFADYLIFNKPIIFAKFDHSKYLNENGLKINYETLPGPKVNNWDDLLFHTRELLYTKDSYIKDRENWKENLYKFKDGKNCERITNYFKNVQKI